MAVIAAQTMVRAGLEATYSAAAAGGDTFLNYGNQFIHVKNGHSGDQTVTIETPGTVDGLAISNRSVVVTAGEERFIGPFPPAYYNNSTGYVSLTYSGVTALTIAVITQGAL